MTETEHYKNCTVCLTQDQLTVLDYCVATKKGINRGELAERILEAWLEDHIPVPKAKPVYQSLTLNLSKGLAFRLETIAEESGLPFSKLIQHALDWYRVEHPALKTPVPRRNLAHPKKARVAHRCKMIPKNIHHPESGMIRLIEGGKGS